MTINTFEDLIVWQKSKNLCLIIYKLFILSKDFGFKDQIQRATVSISNNIAEGFERRSNKEFKQFLFISKGSCGEVRSMTYLAFDLKYINQNDFELINDLTIEMSRLLSGLIKSLNF